MTIDLAADIPEMLEDFGVTVRKSNGNKFTAVLVDEYEAQTVYGLDVDSSAPVLTCKTVDVTTLCTRGDSISVDGVSYKIKSTQDDATGVTVLVLGVD